MTGSVDQVAETLLRRYAGELVAPEPRECLACFVNRMLCEFGCDGTLRFAATYRDTSAPRATALERRLRDRGGFCDCEVLMNVYTPAMQLWTRDVWIDDEEEDGIYIDAEPPDRMPACAGVRAGSTQPCRWWERIGYLQRRYW